MVRTLTVTAVWLAAVVAGHGQTLPDTTIELPAAVVEAARGGGSATSYVRLTTIGPAELEALPVRTVADAIDRRSSVHLLRYGPSGLTTASIRGLGGKHTSVYLDGILLSDPQSNQVDLAVIPVVMLESIEITHGPASAARGAGSLGGSVALNTVRAVDRTRLKIGIDAGEYGQRRFGAVGSTASGPLSVTVSGEISRYEGDYPYRNPTLIDPAPQTRLGADKSSEALYASAAYDKGRHRVSASTWINSVERGLPGPGNAPAADARQWDDHVRLWLQSEHRFDAWQASLAAVGHRTSLRYVNPSSATDDETETTTADLRARISRILGSNLMGAGGLEATFERSGDIAEERLAGFAEATFESGRVIVVPSARVETWITDSEVSSGSDAADASEASDASDMKTTFVPRAGVNIRLSDGDGLHLKANVGRAYRIPSFLERYWQPGGNPNLEAESGWSFDGGIHAQGDGGLGLEGEAGFFLTDLGNQISWFPSLVGSGVQVWRPFNVGRVVTYGVEISGNLTKRLGPALLEAGFSSTLSRATDRSDPSTPSYGKQLRYMPRITASVSAGAKVKSVSLKVWGRHVGRRYVTSDESRRMDAHTVFDVLAGYRYALAGTTAQIALQIENALDARYSVIRFYPMPPRSVAIRLEVEI